MSAKRWFLILTFLLTACQSGLPAPTALPAPQAWQITVDPALKWMDTAISRCSKAQPGIAALITPLEDSASLQGTPDFQLFWGDPANLTGSPFVLGWDEWIIIVHPDNPILGIPAEAVQPIFNGSISTWNEIPDCEACQENASKIQTWRYDGQKDSFLEAFQVNYKASLPAMLGPTPSAMREAIASDPAAIGYIPARWLDASVKKVEIRGLSTQNLRLPIVAVTPEDPEGSKREWLACLQQALVK